MATKRKTKKATSTEKIRRVDAAQKVLAASKRPMTCKKRPPVKRSFPS